MDPIADYWWWLIAGVLLAIAEMVAPGVFLIWIGAAAMLTGLLTMASGVGLPLQLGLFAVSAVGAVYGAQRWAREAPTPSDDPLLNDRTARLIGAVVTVTRAIEHGHGRVAVGDGEWPARGADAASGSAVRIVGAEGGTLVVTPVEGLAAASLESGMDAPSPTAP